MKAPPTLWWRRFGSAIGRWRRLRGWQHNRMARHARTRPDARRLRLTRGRKNDGMRRNSRRRPDSWRSASWCNGMGRYARAWPDAYRWLRNYDRMGRYAGSNRIRRDDNRMRRSPRRRPDFRGRTSGGDRMRGAGTSGHWTSTDSNVGIGHYADDSNGNGCHISFGFLFWGF
jgi:hypothetical protein